MPDFVRRLKEEIRSVELSEAVASPRTLYFGGGTPSLLSTRDFSAIMDTLHERFDLQALHEVTLEVNPDDITPEKLESWLELGVARLSIGVQSFDEALLRFMHRAHDSKMAQKALTMVKDSGYSNFTMDLIYGNPGQNVEMLKQDLDRFLQFDPPHISAYALTIEPRTRLGKMEELGRLTQADEETVIAHSECIQQTLENAGLERYEISNYTRSGFRAVHNSSYWHHLPYLGFGPGAHSFRWCKAGEEGIRSYRKPDLKSYLEKPFTETAEEEFLDQTTLAEERIMTGLRTVEGISMDELEGNYNYHLNDKQCELIAAFEHQGWILSRNPLRLSGSGWHRADRITLELFSAG